MKQQSTKIHTQIYSSEQELGSCVQLDVPQITKKLRTMRLGRIEKLDWVWWECMIFCSFHPKINIFLDIDWSGNASEGLNGYESQQIGIIRISIQILFLFFFFFLFISMKGMKNDMIFNKT